MRARSAAPETWNDGADRVVAQVAGQQADRRGDAGMRRHDHLGDAQHVGHLGAVQRAGAAEGDQREVARVDALLDGARADGVGHVGVDQRDHALRRLALGDARARAASSPITRRAATSVERHPAAEEVLAVEPAEHDVGVGDRRLACRRGRRRPGPGTAPAERGPTLKAPAWSTKAIEPPPAPIVCTSIIGTSTGIAARSRCRAPSPRRSRRR